MTKALPPESSDPAPRTCARCGRSEPDLAVGQCPSCKGFLPGNQEGRTFEQGNDASLVHGAKAGADLVQATESALVEIEAAVGDGPGSEPRFALARASAARALARVRLLEEYLDRVGILDSKGRPRPSTKLLEQAHAGFLKHLEAFGMTPASAARLGLDLTRAKSASIAVQLADARRSASKP